MTDVVHPLFVAVVLSPDESLPSLVARAACANVYDRTAQILLPLGFASPAAPVFSGEATTSRLATLLSVEESEVKARQHPRVACGRPAVMVDWYGTPLPRKFIESARRRVSPAGLRRQPYHRAIWMVRPLGFCPASFERLIDTCPRCGENLGWHGARGSTQCDRCGRTLLRERPGKLPWDYRESYQHAASLVSVNSNERACELALLPAPFCDWQPGEVFEAMVELGHTLGSNSQGRGVKSGDFSEFSEEHLVRGYQFVRAWPKNLEKVVTVAKGNKHGAIQALFGPLGKYFYPGASESPLRDLIRSAAPTILRKLEIVPTIPRSGRLLGNFPSHAGDTINARAASERFRIDRAVLRRLEPSGDCFVTKGGWREGATIYQAEPLREAVRRFHAAKRVDECASLLGVPPFTVPALVEAKLVLAETHHDANLLAAGEQLIDSESVLRLMDRVSRGAPSPYPCGTPLTEAMVGRFHPQSWVKAIHMLADGAIKVLGIIASEDSLFDRLRIDPLEVRRELGPTEPTPPNDIVVSCVVAGKLLGVSNVLINKAFRAGLLAGWQIGKGDVKIALGDLKAFADEFVTPAEGSRLFGLPGKGFYHEMMTLGFQPAGVAVTSTIWRRADVETALALSHRKQSNGFAESTPATWVPKAKGRRSLGA